MSTLGDDDHHTTTTTQHEDGRTDGRTDVFPSLPYTLLTLAEGGRKSPDWTQASTWSGVAATQLHTGGCVPSRYPAQMDDSTFTDDSPPRCTT